MPLLAEYYVLHSGTPQKEYIGMSLTHNTPCILVGNGPLTTAVAVGHNSETGTVVGGNAGHTRSLRMGDGKRRGRVLL